MTEYSVQTCTSSELRGRHLAQWEDLESRAIEANPFLSPLFVLPAIQYLTPNAKVLFFFVYRNDTLIVVGVFELVGWSKNFPLPHLRAYETPNDTFFTNLLIDDEFGEQGLRQLFGFLQLQSRSWRRLEFSQRSDGSDAANLMLCIGEEFGYRWCGWSFERAQIEPSDKRLTDLLTHLSRNKRKQIRRHRKTLEQLGELQFRVLRPQASEACDALGEIFLRLENSGWKGDCKVSLLASQSKREFFRAMTRQFSRQRRIVFTQLFVGGKVIGSTANLIAGNGVIAYRSGWDFEYAHASPGIIQEFEIAQGAPDHLADLDYLDSGTDETDWLSSLWPGRRRVTTGILVQGPSDRFLAKLMIGLRFAKRRVKSRLHP